MKKLLLFDFIQFFRGTFIDEKRRLEARITQLEEELEEEQTNAEIIGDKHKKLAMTVEQLMLDLSVEKANNQKAEVNLLKIRNHDGILCSCVLGRAYES